MIIIEQDGRYLFGKRSTWKTQAAGYWCPISGHIEQGESQEAAVIREAWEEVGLIVKPYRKLTTIDSHDGTVALNWWVVKVIEGEAFLKNNEHSELKWVTIEEMSSLSPVFEEDIAIFQQLNRT